MQSSSNTPSETTTRLGCVIKPPKNRKCSYKAFVFQRAEPCLNHISNEREMSCYLTLEEAVTSLVSIK